MEGNRRMTELLGVRFAEDEVQALKDFGENMTPPRTVQQLLREAGRTLLAEREIADLTASSARELLARRRPRTLAEDVAVWQSVYDHGIEEMCNTAGWSLRRAVLFASGIGSALQKSARDLAEQNGTTFEALMGEGN